jgi:hypothetical protein
MNDLVLASGILRLRSTLNAQTNRRSTSVKKRRRYPSAETWLAFTVVTFGLISALVTVA